MAAAVCFQNVATAVDIAKRLRVGNVWVNMYDDLDAGLPFGGYKESGWGREKGEYVLKNFTEVKIIQFPTNIF